MTLSDRGSTVYLECQCGSKDHVVEVGFEHWADDDIDFCINTQMRSGRGFFRRVWTALRYIFKPQDCCNFGGWTDTLVRHEDVRAIQRLTEEYLRRAG